MVICAVATCKNSRINKSTKTNLSFHRFPKDKKLLEAWLATCKWKNSLNVEKSLVCSDHFKGSDFIEDSVNKMLSLKEARRLKPNCVPSQWFPLLVPLRGQSIQTNALSKDASVQNMKAQENFEMDEEVKYISFSDIISELQSSIHRCEQDCRNCHKYIIKLIRHLRSTHSIVDSDPLGSIDEIEMSTSPRRSNRKRKVISHLATKKRNEDNSSIVIDSVDIKCESDDIEVDPDLDLSTPDDPVYSDLEDGDLGPSVESDFDSKNTKSRDPLSNDPLFFPHCCDKCGKRFSKIGQLNCHAKNHTRDKQFSCSTCGTYFNRKYKLLAHEKDIHKLGMFCKICKENFPTESDVNEHLKSHGERPYGCGFEECDQSFTQKSSLNRHVQSAHTGKKEHVCQSCGKSFTRKYWLTAHERTHTGEEPTHICTICDQGYSSQEGLTRHSAIHTGNESNTCKTCDMTFDVLMDLRRHRLTIKHRIAVGLGQPGSTTKTRLFSCKVCGKKCLSKFTLAAHERSHTGEKPFLCEICSAWFTSKYGLKVHLMRHNEEKRYVCNVCDKGFVVRGQLTKHMRFHTGEKPYKCDQCEKCYSICDKLIIHKRTHTGERPFMCDQCGASFTEKTSLRDHMVTHEEGRAFFCQHCGQGFKRRTLLSSHLLVHTDEASHVCHVCGKRFRLDHKLMLHLRTHNFNKT